MPHFHFFIASCSPEEVCCPYIITGERPAVLLVNPPRPIPPGAFALNGITDAMVIRAPAFPDLFPRILSFLEGDTLVFHNAPFDLSFLRMEARLAGGGREGF